MDNGVGVKLVELPNQLQLLIRNSHSWNEVLKLSL